MNRKRQNTRSRMGYVWSRGGSCKREKKGTPSGRGKQKQIVKLVLYLSKSKIFGLFIGNTVISK